MTLKGERQELIFLGADPPFRGAVGRGAGRTIPSFPGHVLHDPLAGILCWKGVLAFCPWLLALGCLVRPFGSSRNYWAILPQITALGWGLCQSPIGWHRGPRVGGGAVAGTPIHGFCAHLPLICLCSPSAPFGARKMAGGLA